MDAAPDAPLEYGSIGAANGEIYHSFRLVTGVSPGYFPRMVMLPAGKRFIFVAGAEGSGTTLLLRFLSSADRCVSLGGNARKIPPTPRAEQLTEWHSQINAAAWDRTLSPSENELARQKWLEVLAAVVNDLEFASATHFFFETLVPVRSHTREIHPGPLGPCGRHRGGACRGNLS